MTKLNPEERKEQILDDALNWAEEHGLNIYMYDYNSSDGKTTDQRVLSGDWHDKSCGRIGRLVEKLFTTDEIECRFYDEITTCSECGKAVVTQPSHYGWIPNFIRTEYDIICRDCVEESPEFILDDAEEIWINVSDKAVYPWFVPFLKPAGWACLETDTGCATYETGWHPGQDDDPEKVLEWIQENLPDYDCIFAITSVGQFDTHWTAYIKKRENNDGT